MPFLENFVTLLSALRAQLPDDLGPWFYLLGLVATALLPIKNDRAYRGICLALTLLWGCQALAAPPSDLFWTSLSALQALLFFGVAAAWGRGRLELPARNGSWAVAGTVLILYSLLVFPLLARLDIPGFNKSAFDTPFPLVLFTCGVLLFAVNRMADLVFALPLLWALLGGPSDDEGFTAELVGLQAALLTGVSFLLLPPSLRGGIEGRTPPGASYRFSYQRRAAFGYGLWGLILTTLLFLFFAAEKREIQTDTSLGRLTVHLILLSVLGSLLWLAFPAWQSLWFRYVAWWTARAVGRVCAWLRQNWRWGLLLIVLISVLASSIPDEKSQPTVPKTEESGWFASWWSDTRDFLASLTPPQEAIWMVGAIGLLWLLYEAYQGRRRLVIDDFANKAGESPPAWISGLGARLQNELARIADLYKVIDEARPSRGSNVVEVVPGVEEVGTILKQAISTTFGSSKIAPIAEIFTRIMSGPRLKGAVHKVGDDYVITAELAGGGLTGSWHVDLDSLSEDERKLAKGKLAKEDLVHAVVDQLAFRVATDLVSIGSPRWRAVRCFTEGLRFYRETQRQNEKDTKLREAERCFIRALKDDQRFTQCYYNLGVVYRQLGELGSAESVFRRVLREDTNHLEACYALAETLVEAEKYGDAVRFCDAAIGIDATDARAWDLEAYALRHREQVLKSVKVTLPPNNRVWERVQEKSEIAVALAWRALCRQALQGTSAELHRETTTALLCTRNLAVVLTRAGNDQDSKRVFQQAAWLAPYDPDLRLYEGRTLYWTRSWEGATTALEGVIQEGLEPVGRGLLWSTLAQTRARSGSESDRPYEARLAHRRFLDLVADASPEDLQKIVDMSLETPRTPAEGKTRRGT